jgi:hypothetical protein
MLASSKMKKTRIIVALSVAIFVTLPFVGLAHLSRDIRYLDFFDKAFKETDMPFPVISSIMLPFGPLDWWSYLTPAALSVAVAASLRSPIPPFSLALILGSSIVQSLVMVAAAGPYFSLTKVMGYFPTTPYPTGPLVANLVLMAASIVLAVFSLWRMVSHDGNRPRKTNSGQGAKVCMK